MATPAETFTRYEAKMDEVVQAFSSATDLAKTSAGIAEGSAREALESQRAAAQSALDSALLSVFTPRGAFAGGTAYALKDVYNSAGVAYVAVIAHTSTSASADLAAGKVTIHQGATREDLLAASGAALIGANTYQTQDDVNLERVSVKRFPQTQAGFAAAVAFAYASGAELYWPAGTYISTSSIPNFHNVTHTGTGTIQRGAYIWHVTPRLATHVNEQFVSAVGTSGNDGLSPNEPTTISTLFGGRLPFIGSKALAGQWRVRIIGTIAFNGFVMTGLPAFARPLQIWGEDVVAPAEPTSWWDGATSSVSYALRSNHGNTILNFDFKNIGFKNWSNESGNAGAFVTDDKALVAVDNCRFQDCEIGLWVLQSYIKVIRSKFINCTTWGVCVQYLSYGNVGGLTTGYGNTFTNCGTSVAAGRSSVMYVQNNDFNEIVAYAVEYNKNSRGRTQGNRYNSWAAGAGLAIINTVEGAIYNPDNSSGYPDVFNLTLSEAQPAFQGVGDTIHSHIQTGQGVVGHAVIDYASASYNVAATRKALVDFNPAVHPFNLPAYTLYAPSFKLTLELDFYVQTGQSVLIELSGAGTSVASRIAWFTTPVTTANTRCKAKVQVHRYSADTGVVFDVEIPSLGFYSYGNQIGTNISNALVRSASEGRNAFRLYATLAQPTSVLFYGARTYVEV